MSIDTSTAEADPIVPQPAAQLDIPARLILGLRALPKEFASNLPSIEVNEVIEAELSRNLDQEENK